MTCRWSGRKYSQTSVSTASCQHRSTHGFISGWTGKQQVRMKGVRQGNVSRVYMVRNKQQDEVHGRQGCQSCLRFRVYMCRQVTTGKASEARTIS
jgi:hypothetical protein